MYQTEAASKCEGCKSSARMQVGCPFITCAVKKKGVEFCWECSEHETCEKWGKHREAGRHHDSFKCYQRLEDDIAIIRQKGINEFDRQQKLRDRLLKEMLVNFNDGRSKSYYCIAATVFPIEKLQENLTSARAQSEGFPLKNKAKVLHSILDSTAKDKGYLLKLRK
jgi:hypothetical protein